MLKQHQKITQYKLHRLLRDDISSNAKVKTSIYVVKNKTLNKYDGKTKQSRIQVVAKT